MGITLSDLPLEIKGIIHIGAGTITEAQEYQNICKNTIYWFEPIKESYEIGLDNIKNFKNQHLFNVAITDKKEKRNYFITENSGSSSSVLPLKEHLKMFPKAQVIEEREIQCYSLDEFIKEYNLDTSEINTLVIDVQGAELLALKGMTETLKNIEQIIIEVNDVEMYESNPYPFEIENFLKEKNFELTKNVKISMGQSEQLYILKGKNNAI